MLQTKSDLIANKSTLTNKYDINKFGIVDKANLKTFKSRTKFIIPKTRLVFAKLRQVFSTTLILYYFS